MPDQGQSTLRLRLLGAPQMERDGCPVHVDTRKAVALLAYLAVTGQAHSRDTLAALLWPEYEPSRAYANLRRTLWALGKAIGKEWLLADADLIGLRRQRGYWLDVDEFRAQLSACAGPAHAADFLARGEGNPLCLDALTAAVSLYRDDFCAGFSLRDSSTYDDWQFFEAEGLRQELAGALERLILCITATGEYETAIPHARRWVALDPLHEPAHRMLMRLYALSGQRSAALRQYTECMRQLEQELGTTPDGETSSLAQAIEARHLLPPEVSAPLLSKSHAEAEHDQAGQPPHTPPNNLPLPLTPFVGRADEMLEIASLLDSDECRLLSLVGPGGIGKTRLALETARKLVERPENRHLYPQGVFLVSLAGLQSQSHVTPAIASAIGFSFYIREGQSPEEQLTAYLAGKRMLLVLDNMEHLLISERGPQDERTDSEATGIRLLAGLLSAAPAVKVLVTSRERLNLQGEWVVSIEGMPYPDMSSLIEPAECVAARYSAVELFLQRARMVDSGFHPSNEDMGHVLRICQLVEGWPLGIELAAAWIRTLPVAEIRRELEQGLDLLSTSLRNVPTRHRSLRAVCDHSWRLLSAEEQAVFRRLSVFRSGFPREAAAVVSGASLPGLRALLDKSMLHRVPSVAERYALHQVLHQYAGARLAESPDELEQARDLHCGFYSSFLAGRAKDLRSHRQAEALDEIATEVENVRAAWQWAVDRLRVADMRQAAEALFRFWLVRKGFAEGERAFGQAAERLESAECVAACRAAGLSDERLLTLGLTLTFQSHLAQYTVSRPAARAIQQRGLAVLRPLGMRRELALANLNAAFWSETEDFGVTEAALQESLAFFKESGDLWGAGRCLHALAYDPLAEREVTDKKLEQSLAVSVEAGDWWGVAEGHFALGEGAHMAGAFGEALQHYGRALEIRNRLNDRMGRGTILDYMGYVQREMGHLGEARRLHQESLALSEEMGDRLGVAGSLDNLGLVALEEGRFAEAQSWLEQGLALRRSLASGWEVSISLQQLGAVAFAQGDLQTAEARYRDSLQMSQDLIWTQGTALSLAGLARVLAAQGQSAQARKHAASALSLVGLLGNRVRSLDVLLAAGEVLRTLGDLEPAAELLAYVEQSPASAANTRTAAESSLSRLAMALGRDVVTGAREQARPQTLEQVAENGQAALYVTASE